MFAKKRGLGRKAGLPVHDDLVARQSTAGGGRGDGQQPGVVGEPGLVAGEPPVVVQELPGWLGQQVRDGGPLGDELPPAAQRGQLPFCAVSAVRS